MKDILEQIIKLIVSDEGEVKVSEVKDQIGTLYEVTVSKKDMGLVIGKMGDTARALKTVMRAFGAKRQEKIAVRFLEPNYKPRI